MANPRMKKFTLYTQTFMCQRQFVLAKPYWKPNFYGDKVWGKFLGCQKNRTIINDLSLYEADYFKSICRCVWRC